MNTLLNEGNTEIVKEECGCYSECINGKYITILCDIHEEEYQDMHTEPLHFKKTKMRKAWDL